MKRFTKKVCFVVLVICIMSSQAFAYINSKPTPGGYDIYWSDDAILFDFFNYYYEQYNNAIAVASPYEFSYLYQVVISYDELSSMVFSANELGFNVSLYRNNNAGYWVGHVYDVDESIWDGGLEISGVLCNANGYVYVAEIDTTGEDAVGLLDSISEFVINIERWTYKLYNGQQFLLTNLEFVKRAVEQMNTALGKIQTTVVAINDSSTEGTIAYNIAQISAALIKSGKTVADYLYSINTSFTTIGGLLSNPASPYYRAVSFLASELAPNSAGNLVDNVAQMAGMVTDVDNIYKSVYHCYSYLKDIQNQLIGTDTEGTLAYNIAGTVALLESIQTAITSEDFSNTDFTLVVDKLDEVKDYLYSPLKTIETSILYLRDPLYATAYHVVSDDIEGTLAYNIVQIVTLLEEIQASRPDTTTIIEKLDLINIGIDSIGDQLTGSSTEGTIAYNIAQISAALIKSGKTVADYLYSINTSFTTIGGLLGNPASPYYSAVSFLASELNAGVAGTLVGNVAQMVALVDAIDTDTTTIIEKLDLINIGIDSIGDQLTGSSTEGTIAYNIASLTTMQQEIIDLLEDMNTTAVEKIENITIDASNKAYEIFYITDGDGNEQNLGEFSGDVLSIGGRLLNFFFKAAFDGALDSVDSALDDMSEFYIEDSVVLEGGSLWD